MELAILLTTLLLIALHFLPWIIALMRNHHNTVAIFLVNLLLGWTLIGWVVALIWSFTNRPVAIMQPPQVVVNNIEPSKPTGASRITSS